MLLRHTTRKLALALGTVVLAAPALTSCGFNYATDRVYTPADGVNYRDASVDVLGADIVSAQPGSGTFIASFANNDQDDPATVESLRGAGDDADVQVEEFDPIEIPAGGLVNLATEGGIPLHDDFEAGDFVTLVVTFGDGESVEMEVPTVADCEEFEGLDISAESGRGSSSSSSTAEPSAESDEQCATPDATTTH